MAFPGQDWEEATPASQGLDRKKLDAAAEYLRKNSGRDGVRELAIIRNGRLVWKGEDIDRVHGVWSCTKSFTSTALGLLIDDGKCTLDTQAADLVSEMKQHYGEVTLRHFTTMTSGYRAVGDEPRGSYLHGPSNTPFEPSPQPLFTPPGSQYAYWDSAMNMFALVLTRIAGEPLEELFKRRIADPIGMNPKQWNWGDYDTDRGIVVNGGSGNGGKHILISAREMARLGHLFLNKGNWNGKQLISRTWVEAATSVHVPATTPWAQPASEIDGRGVYGFNWWVNGATAGAKPEWPGAPTGTFAASGYNNNRMFVIPEWRMVVVRLGLDQQDGRIGADVWGKFLAMIGEARTDDLKADDAKLDDAKPDGAGADGAAERLRFRHHYIERDLPGDSYGQTSLVDVDRDGDLDFITGGKGPDKSIYWFEYRGPDDWARHVLGTNHPSDVGGTAFDVDGDGWIDHVSGGVWYRSTGRPRSEAFERTVFDGELARVHDLVAADLDRDGRLDVVTMSDKNNLRWYRIPKDPRQRWQRRDIGGGVHAGVAVSDIDGDGDLDVVRSNAWFENADGSAGKWIEHVVPFGNPKPPYPLATRCRIVDLDRDGDADLVMTENEIRAGRIAWLENADGKGGKWDVHDLPAGDTAPRGAYHSLAVADFDNDGDADVFSVEMEAIAGARPPRWFVWENLDGKSGEFVERVIFAGKLGGHEAVAADVDGDGDVDLCAKLWRPRRDNANQGRNHADYLENLLIDRATVEKKPNGSAAAKFRRSGSRQTSDVRPLSEVWRLPLQGPASDRSTSGKVPTFQTAIADDRDDEADLSQPLKGQIVVDPEHPEWLMRHGGGHVFICGPGDPEDFLYRGKRNADGTRDGDQERLIRKLIEHGGNCIYLQAVRSGGDGPRDHNPFVAGDPRKGVNAKVLDQWEEWFTLMDEHGIVIYLFLYDDGVRPFGRKGDADVSPPERQFVETLVRRFRHHKNLIWIVAEESEEALSGDHVRAIARIIQQNDHAGRLIGDHHHSGTTFKNWRPGSALNHFAMQLAAAGKKAHAGAIEARKKAAGRYQVIYAESTAARPDALHAWACAMGGLMPMMLKMDIAGTPDATLEQCRHLTRFFESTDFYTLAPHDELAIAGTEWVLADPGRSYIAYSEGLKGGMGVRGLKPGPCALLWLDCRSGETVAEKRTTGGETATFARPEKIGPWCAVWIHRPKDNVP